MQQKGSVIMCVRQCAELHRRSIVSQCDCECLWLCVMMQVRSCFKWGCSRDVSTIYGTVPCVCSRYGYDLLLCLLNYTLTVLYVPLSSSHAVVCYFMIAYLSLLYHSPEGGVIAYILEWSGCTYHFVRQTLLQHTQPAPSYSACTACATLDVLTLYVSCEYPHAAYVCVCAPVPHVIVFKQFVHASSTLWHTYCTCEHTVRDIGSSYKHTNQAKGQKQPLNTTPR